MSARCPDDVQAARKLADKWAEQSGEDPADLLGSAWLAIHRRPNSHRLAPCRQAEEMARHMPADLELAPVEASEAMHPQVHLDEAILLKQFVRRMNALLLTFPPRTERILRLHYGMGRQEPMKLIEISELPGTMLTTARLTQIINKALRIIRHPIRTAYVREAAYGELGALLDSMGSATFREMVARKAVVHPDDEYGARMRWRARTENRRRFESRFNRKTVRRYQEAFGQDWHLMPVSTLLDAKVYEQQA